MKVISKKHALFYFLISILIGSLVALLGYFYGMGDGSVQVLRFALCVLAFFSFVAAFSDHPTEPGEKFKTNNFVIVVSLCYFLGLLFSGFNLETMRFNKLMSGETIYVSGYISSSYKECHRTCHWNSRYVYEVGSIEYTGVMDRKYPLQKNYWVTFRVANGDHTVFEVASYDKEF